MPTDKHLIAAKTQEYEVDYIANKYNIPKDVVKAVIEQVGISRKKVYKILRELGYMNEKKGGSPAVSGNPPGGGGPT